MDKGKGTDHLIVLAPADLREGLRCERNIQRAHDMMHVAENEHVRYVEHLRALYNVPVGWVLRDWMRGFEPPEQDGQAAGGGNGG